MLKRAASSTYTEENQISLKYYQLRVTLSAASERENSERVRVDKVVKEIETEKEAEPIVELTK